LGKARKEIMHILDEAAPRPKTEEGKTHASSQLQNIVLKNYLEGLDL
jgi:hypothetical protein